MSYKKTKSFGTVVTTGILPKVDVVLLGIGATSITATVSTSKMSIGESIIIKRNIGSTGVLTVKGETGNIETGSNTLAATTTIGTGASATNIMELMWTGTDLIRLIN